MLSFVTLTLLAPLGAPPSLDEVVHPRIVRYTVDAARSEVGFDGTSSLHDFTGRTRDVEGQLLLDPADPTRYAAGSFACKAESLDTDNASRDEKMREHLDVENFPRISFDLVRALGVTTLEGAAPLPEFSGAFSIHGVQRDYHVAADISVDVDGALHVAGRVPLRLREHGIVPPAVLMVEVGEEVEVWFDLVMTPTTGGESAARAHVLSVRETLQPAGGERSVTETSELFFAELDAEGAKPTGAALWERADSGTWIVAQGGVVSSIELAAERRIGARQSAEDSFGEARATMQRLESKLSKLTGVKREKAEAAVADRLAQLREVLAHAPEDAPLEVLALDDGRAWRIGDSTWLEVHGRVGDGAFVPLLGSLEGLPAGVRDALSKVDGVPARTVVRCATMGGVRSLEILAEPAVAGSVPTHAFEARGAGR